VHNDWSAETRLKDLLLPLEVVFVHLVSLKDLAAELLVGNLIFVRFNVSLLFSGVSGLVLEVEPDGQLEIALHSSALVSTLESVIDLDINLRTVEGTITGV